VISAEQERRAVNQDQAFGGVFGHLGISKASIFGVDDFTLNALFVMHLFQVYRFL
jgi:hypothetical protein